MRKTLTIMILAIVANVGTLFAEVKSGKCGDNLNWTFDYATRVLDITGSGDMYDFDWDNPAPWAEVNYEVEFVNLPNGLTSIGNYAFKDFQRITTSISIPNGVIRIGEYAFYDCINVEAISIPNSVTSIGQYAFGWCERLRSATLPTILTDISDGIFWHCSSLSSITIPDKVTTIGESAFSDCSSLSSITIPHSVNTIGLGAFISCTGLTSFTLPNSIISIGKSILWGCANLGSVVVEAGNTVYDSRDNCNAIIETATNTLINGCKTTVIPNTVTAIGDYAFGGCTGLQTVVIPNHITSVGEYAFSGCTGVTSVTIGEKVTRIEGVFDGCTNLTTVVWNATDCPTRYSEDNRWVYPPFWGIRDQITTFTFGENMKVLPDYICDHMKNLTSVTIPEGVVEIGRGAFRECISLSVTIPSTVTTIGEGDGFLNVLNVNCNKSQENLIYGAKYFNGFVDGCFVYADETKTALVGCAGNVSGDVIIPNGVTLIGVGAFASCDAMESITVPSSVTQMEMGAFGYLYALKAVHISDLSSWCRIQFESYDANPLAHSHHLYLNGKEITDLVIPAEITGIGDFAFYGCHGLTSVTLHNDVISIGKRAFEDCPGLTAFVLPNSVKSVGESPFWRCSGITTPIHNDKLFVFLPTSYAGSYTIPNGIETLVSGAFYSCSLLTSLTIPESVTNIEGNVISGCYALTRILLQGAIPPTITYNSFGYDRYSAYVPNKYLEAYLNSQWKDMVQGFVPTDPTVGPTSATLDLTHQLWAEENDYVVACGEEGGEMMDGNIFELTGLEPNSSYSGINVELLSAAGLQEVVSILFQTSSIELSTLPARLTSESSAVIIANTNMSDSEVSCGFEFRRTGASDAVPSQVIGCPVANGTMAVKVKNLKAGTEYKYRPFYKSAAENMYYGDWSAFDPQDAYITYEPVLYTYQASAVTETEATLKGYALEGSDDFVEQGFEYWADSRVSPDKAPAAGRRTAIGEKHTIAATGMAMKVTLTNLDEGTVYKYRTYAKSESTTVYGSEMSFTTKGQYNDPMSIETPSQTENEESMIMKFLRDGQLYILRDGVMYTVQGAIIE